MKTLLKIDEDLKWFLIEENLSNDDTERLSICV